MLLNRPLKFRVLPDLLRFRVCNRAVAFTIGPTP